MNIVITMAGLGSRFRKKGYKEPKYMITVKGRSLFYWSLISLSYMKNDKSKYIFIVRKEDNSREFICQECELLNIFNYDVIEIDHLTDGQATTVLSAQAYWKTDDPLLIYNIDTHVSPEALHHNYQGEDGWIPCFDGPGEKWSFVKIDDNGNAIEVREKKRISSNATVGLYWFSSATIYTNAYKTYYSLPGNEEKGERYIAPLYNQLIADGFKIRISSIPSSSVHTLGTPEELEQFNDSDYFHNS